MCSTTSCSFPLLKCWNSTESPWEFLRREPKTQQLQCTESRSHDAFVLEKGIYPVLGGKQDLRSQHLLSSLALRVLEARHITTVWLKIYTLSDMFSLIFLPTLSPAFCWELFKVREWLLSQLFCYSFSESQTLELWICNKCGLTKVKHCGNGECIVVLVNLCVWQKRQWLYLWNSVDFQLQIISGNARQDLSLTLFTVYCRD